MKVKLIIVDELPENCLSCDISQKHGLDFYCPLINKVLYDALGYLPENCPLVVEDVCKWKLTDCGISEDEPYAPHIWLGEYKCEDGWYQGEKPYYKFCPLCGKRIKYVEE